MYNQRKRKSKASKALRHVAQATKAIILCEMLEALTRLAITYETALVRESLVDQLSIAACGEGSLKAEALSFGWLMRDVSCSAPARFYCW
jgi:hypothetical protein